MRDEQLCPFWFGNSFNDVYCYKSKCALWVDEGENSCCGLVYQARQQVASHKILRREREEFRKRYKEKWG